MELSLDRLGQEYRKTYQPPCACCGYDAEWVLRIEKLYTKFCERCMVNALLDAVNFNVQTPSGVEA